MFYWVKRAAAGSGPLDGLSKTDILRGVVSEKLSTAAQEILAVVERTVAGYEEEAAALRTEVEKQKKQLELLLQPRVSLERTALVPDEEGHEVVVLSEEEEEEEEKITHQSAVGDTGSLGLLWFNDEDEDEERRAAASSRRRRDDLKDPDYQTTPSCRLVSPRGRSDRRRPGRPRSCDTQSLLVLRVCILEDSRTLVLSNTVFKKYPVQEVRCPRGLQEEDFLDLLRSTFPQLAAQRPFDVFTSDRTKTLQPLRVETLTPEEICRSIRLSGGGNSALYIRLKSGEDPQSEDLRPLQRSAASPSGSATTSADETETFTRLSSPSAQSDKRRRGRPRLGEEPTHRVLRVCLLEDGRSDLLTSRVPDRSSVQEVRCPRGLQEEDFLDLLRSTFPQLEGRPEPLEVFRSDRSRRLQRITVTTLTPEEILRNRTAGEKTLIYIRLKTGDKEEEEELNLSQRRDDVTSDDVISDSPSAAVTKNSEEAELSSSPVQHEGGNGADVPSQRQDEETEDAADEDADDDWEPDLPQTRKRKRAAKASAVERELTPSVKTACAVCGVWYRTRGSLIKHAWSHADEPRCVCGVCGQRFESTDDLKGHLKKYQKTHECSSCRKSFLTATGLRCHATLHTGNRPFKCDVCGKTFAHVSSLSNHRWVHVEEKPYRCTVCPKAFGLRAQLRAHVKVHTGRDRYHCSVCGKSLYDLRSLTRHKATHSGERRYGCDVCGKRFKLSCTLKSHEKTHTVRERPFLCHVCCKTFLSNCGLTAHMRTHSGERPFACGVCGKGFVSNGELRAHTRVHTGEAPYGCSQCGRFFKRKTHLSNHVRSHLGVKAFVCGVCGKPCARQEHLTVHMRTHNGERPYQCTVCERAFTQSHCLKTHMKSHRGGAGGEEDTLLNAP
ncbi:zinc finger protein 37-like [Anoplopoma fimbria]|uniref:zinc finger protein 37-like n=1 Tax=Anoplopoma fimbria TaxID=229290 RepID=UPI0023EC04D0|nr:zinc finger protein 37-like [Anoplopoma fimbria]